MSDQPLNLASLRLKLQTAEGKRYWRSLDELAGTPEFEEMVHREFPEAASEWSDALSRRNFLRVMAASLALAGLQGCTKEPQERIVPYVRPPATGVPGRPLHFASAMPLRGIGSGVLITSREGRPIKVEGNPDHPDSLGASSIYMQASILSLYDPDRSQTPIHHGDVSDWSAFKSALASIMETKRQTGGAGLRILTETITSPSLLAQLTELLKTFPEARWHRYEPCSRDAIRAGAMVAFGRKLDPIYHFDKADVILSLDSDFLSTEPGSLRYARQFIDRRRIRTISKDGLPMDAKSVKMNRLYAVESSPTVVGAMADHRLPLKPSDIGALTLAVANAIGGVLLPPAPTPADGSGQQKTAGAGTGGTSLTAWVAKVAADLVAHRGAALVIAGESQPPEVHAIVFAINAALGAVGSCITFIEPLDPHPADSIASLRSLVDDMNAGQVDTLLIVGGNPLYTAPVDFHFLAAMEKVALRIHLGGYDNETAFQCHWHLPEAHYLEAWGDVRAFDGTVSIIQPLIAPLYQGKSAHEVFSMLAGRMDVTGYEIVRAYWAKVAHGDFESWWKATLEKGIVEGSAAPGVAGGPPVFSGFKDTGRPPVTLSSGLELSFLLDPTVFDGRFSNNAWLQELPKPLTHLTWDNAVMISPHLAESIGVQSGDLVEIFASGRALQAAAWIMPGQADGAVSLSLGYGRTRAGRVGGSEKQTRGFNAYALRTSSQPFVTSGVTIKKAGGRYTLATTQSHHGMETGTGTLQAEVVAHPEGNDEIRNRKLIRVATLAEFEARPRFAQEIDEEDFEDSNGHRHVPLQLFPDHDYSTKSNPLKHRWAMSIDTQSCIGCNACVIACQAENNIPVVGKDQVDRGREMHWIRIDSYYAGGLDDPETYFQPITCMHCESAPCELVCPVEATVHDDEGINNMVYNRCVGTRYCSNNCPYKVRRFNFLQYQDQTTEQYKLMRNPEVTVRSRGVMEKCTYCIQRINNTRIDMENLQVRMEEQIRATRSDTDHAELQNQLDAASRKLMGGIQTACQQSCPTEAIVFGDLNDPLSAVSLLKREPHDYGLLEELSTKPRTTYLARVRNPNVVL